MSEAEEQAARRRAQGALFQEVDNMEAKQVAEGSDPTQNRMQFPEIVTVSLRVPRDIHYQLQQIAHRDGLSMRRLLQVGIEMVLQRADEGTLPKLPSWPEAPGQD